MDVYQTEEEQIEAIKKWWKENGTSIVLGIVLGLGAIFGWREWSEYRLDQAHAASGLYQNMVNAVRDRDYTAARKTADRVFAEYPGTTYAVFTRLLLARISVEDNKLDTAARHLRTALEKADNEALRHVIRLRLARILLSQDQPGEAEQVLKVAEQGEFAASYDELRGDIKVKLGDLVAARSAYQESLVKARNNSRDISAIEIKLNSVGRE